MNRVLVSLILVLILNNAKSQITDFDSADPLYINVGQPCPEFVIKNVEYYPRPEISVKELRGQWLILEFWNKFCGACISNFPELNRMQKKFAGKVRFLQIGVQDKEGEIQSIYEKLRTRLHLELPCAFDSTLCKRLDIYTSPHAVLIDPEGIVKGVTTFFTEKNLEDLIAGRQPVLRKTYWRVHDDSPQEKNENEHKTFFKYSDKLPYLIRNNGGPDSSYLFRSLLAKYDPSIGNGVFAPSSLYPLKKGRLEVIKADLKELYFLAYIGKPAIELGDSLYSFFWQWPILEISDSSMFKWDDTDTKGLYDYSLSVPPNRENEAYLMQIMQNDLFNYFGFKVHIEMRKMPYWEVTVPLKTKNDLRSKSVHSSVTGDPFVEKFVNYPFKRILSRATKRSGLLYKYFINTYNKEDYFPIENLTDIDFNVDITLDGRTHLLTDPEAVRTALINNGFHFEVKYRSMKCVIIQ